MAFGSTQFKPLKKQFGALKLTKIGEQHIEQYKAKRRREKIGKVTINGELNVLSAILTYAREGLKIPCASPKIRRFKVRARRGRVQAFTREEVGLLLAAAKLHFPKFYPVVLFLFETGVRKSEAINLPWSNVVFEQKIARIWSATNDDGDDEDDDSDADDEYTVKSVEREVPLSDDLLAVLKAQKLTALSPEWVFPATTDRCHTKGERYAFFPKYTWKRLLAKATTLRRAPVVKELMDGGASAEEADEHAAQLVPEIKGGPHKARHT